MFLCINRKIYVHTHWDTIRVQLHLADYVYEIGHTKTDPRDKWNLMPQEKAAIWNRFLWHVGLYYDRGVNLHSETVYKYTTSVLLQYLMLRHIMGYFMGCYTARKWFVPGKHANQTYRVTFTELKMFRRLWQLFMCLIQNTDTESE